MHAIMVAFKVSNNSSDAFIHLINLDTPYYSAKPVPVITHIKKIFISKLIFRFFKVLQLPVMTLYYSERDQTIFNYVTMGIEGNVNGFKM
jgi:hypothetical protein